MHGVGARPCRAQPLAKVLCCGACRYVVRTWLAQWSLRSTNVMIVEQCMGNTRLRNQPEFLTCFRSWSRTLGVLFPCTPDGDPHIWQAAPRDKGMGIGQAIGT